MTISLQSINDIYDALGGIAHVAAIAGASYNASANWKSFGRFPTRYYLVITQALSDRGYSAGPEFWNMIAPHDDGAAE